MLPLNSKNLEEYVDNWNRLFPIDKWYRKKFKIPFNSIQHRNISIIDMYFEYIENYKYDYKIKKIKELDERKEKLNNMSPYIKGKGNFMKDLLSTASDIDKAFDELDIDSL